MTRVEYRWYAPEVTRFEASWVGGQAPDFVRPTARIHVTCQGKTASFVGKEEAVNHVRKLIESCPPGCRSLFEEHEDRLKLGIFG